VQNSSFSSEQKGSGKKIKEKRWKKKKREKDNTMYATK